MPAALPRGPDPGPILAVRALQLVLRGTRSLAPAARRRIPLGKAELGIKLTCESCGGRYYDLNKTPANCPKCGTANSRPTVFKTRSSSRPIPEEREEKRAPIVAAPTPEGEEDVLPA